MNKTEKIIKLKLDIVFKRMFGNENHKDIIAAFLSDMLEIPRDSISAIYINNTEITPDYLYQKFSRLDLKLEVDDKIVNIEMQVNAEPYFNDRTLFYWAKIYSDELKSGEGYDELKQTICINIINFNMFDCEDYHSHFKVMEKERHEILTDKFSIHFFELKKVGKSQNRRRMEEWLKLINSETEGELMEIENTTTSPEIKQTIVKLRELSADEKLREAVYYREKRLHDEATKITAATNIGIGIGREQGIEIGREQGIEIGKEQGIEIGKEQGIGIGREQGIEIGKEQGIEIGKEQGKESERKEIITKLLKKGFTEEEINDMLA